MATRDSLISGLLAFSALYAEPSLAQTAPSATYDVVQVADTLGLRPGMTLAEARAKATATGAVMDDVDKRYPKMHSGFVGGPNPAYFVRGVGLNPRNAIMNSIDSSGASLRLSVFPKDPRVDYRDENNLVIYYISAQFRLGSTLASMGMTMSGSEFREAAHLRYGPFKAARGSPKAACGAESAIFVGAEKMAAYKSVGGETQADHTPQTLIAARQCPRLDTLDALEQKGQVTGASLWRYDFALAEQAYMNLTKVVGHEPALEQTAKARAAK